MAHLDSRRKAVGGGRADGLIVACAASASERSERGPGSESVIEERVSILLFVQWNKLSYVCVGGNCEPDRAF